MSQDRSGGLFGGMKNIDVRPNEIEYEPVHEDSWIINRNVSFLSEILSDAHDTSRLEQLLVSESQATGKVKGFDGVGICGNMVVNQDDGNIIELGNDVDLGEENSRRAKVMISVGVHEEAYSRSDTPLYELIYVFSQEEPYRRDAIASRRALYNVAKAVEQCFNARGKKV